MPKRELQNSKNRFNSPDAYIDRETKKKIEEHLFNFNHKISEEDLRNVKTDISLLTQQVNPQKIMGK